MYLNVHCSVIETMAVEEDKWHSKMQNSRVLFSTCAGPAESSPKAECPSFVLGIFYTQNVPTQTAQVPPLPK